MEPSLLNDTTDTKSERKRTIEDETEDEEVKLNCIGGRRGIQDSDLSSDSDFGAAEEDDMEQEEGAGVVQFSGGQAQQSEAGPHIYRPKPARLSPHPEETNEGMSSGESASSSVGARGAPISFGGSNDGDRSSCDDEVTSLDELVNNLAQNDDDGDTASNSGILETTTATESERSASSISKRVLSSNTLAALNADAVRMFDSPKRMRTSPEAPRTMGRVPEFSLGLPAIPQQPLPRQEEMRDSPTLSSDEEELDKALSLELHRASLPAEDNQPVPLLTPPQSPVNVPADDGAVEWPSNLVVDSAMMTAATVTRPLSPNALQKLEQEEEERLKDAYSHPEPSTLTPMLRSIYVGID